MHAADVYTEREERCRKEKELGCGQVLYSNHDAILEAQAILKPIMCRAYFPINSTVSNTQVCDSLT